jgi:hypothetical protein
MTDHPLAPVLGDVLKPVAAGKGRRHGGDSIPFLIQPWKTITDQVGVGFLLGQGVKKALEAPQKETEEKFEEEILGAIAYLSMAVLYNRLDKEV